MEAEQTNILRVGTDRYGRTWRVLDRDDSFSVYYTKPDSPAHHVIYDSLDEYNDPPRVLLGRAQEAAREVARLLAQLAAAREENKRDAEVKRNIMALFNDPRYDNKWTDGDLLTYFLNALQPWWDENRQASLARAALEAGE